MASADVHHRTADFRAVYQRVLADLKEFIGTKNDVLLLACSGSGAMEASVANLTSPGDRVLVLTAGKFGERWRDLAKAFNCKVDLVEAPYGETYFSRRGEGRAYTGHARGVHAGVGEFYRRASRCGRGRQTVAGGSDTLLVVDGITGLGTMHFDVDGWGIDVIIGGSQKA